jgi:serine/threonine protein kinase
MEINYLCMGCMSEKGEAETCPICGLKEGEVPESPLFLPVRTILNGRYLIGRVLGYGGFGITYLALDLNLRIKLALKEYLPQNLATRAPGNTTVSVYSGEARDNFTFGLDRFLDEARTLALFNNHPCIVSVTDFFKENDTAYLVMSYIEGITFKDYLDQKGGKISYEAAIEVIIPVMDALREIHNAKMLHRDISPDNIYITKNKQVKLLDFGAARYAVGEHSKSLSVILKPGYAPEEQYRSKGKQGPWTDVYAVAATIYRAITGETPPEALDRIEEDTLVKPSNMGVGIPAEVEAVLLWALSVKASTRPQSIEELQKGLMSANQSKSNHQEASINHVNLSLNENRDNSALSSKDPDISSQKPKSQEQFDVVQNQNGKRFNREKQYLAYGIGGLVIIVVSLSGLGYRLGWFERKIEKTVPSVIQMTITEAFKVLNENHLKAIKSYEDNDEAAQGIVIRQKPASGTKVGKNSEVELIISSGPSLVIVPSVEKKTVNEAIKLLSGCKLRIKNEYVEDNSVDEGVVISQDPSSGEKVPINTVVKVRISKRADQVSQVSNEGQTSKRYNNLEYGFSIVYPQGWIKEVGRDDVIVSFYSSNDRKTSADFVIYVADGSKLTLDNAFKIYINGIIKDLASSNHGTAKVVSMDKNIELGGQEAYTVKFTSSGDSEIVAAFGFTIYKEQLYILAFVAREEDYQLYFDLAAQMVNSFRFTQ